MIEIGILLLFYAAMYLAAGTVAGTGSKTDFYLAGRSVPMLPMAASIAATWIWAMAVFVLPQKVYLLGLPGWFYAVVPNILTLIAIGYIGKMLLEKYPNGFTLSEFIENKFSNRVGRLYQIELILVGFAAIAVQFTAIAKFAAAATSMPLWIISGIVAGGTLAYTLRGGLRASIKTDAIQMIALGMFAFVLLPLIVYNGGGIDLTGVSGTHGSLFDWGVFSTFGIIFIMATFTATFGDQSYWQRVYTIGKDKIVKTFLLGAALFAVVPISFGLLGAVGTHMGLVTEGVTISVIEATLGSVGMTVMLVIVLAALSSTVDSAICAIGSIISNDVLKETDNDIMWSKIAITGFVLGAYLISILGLNIWIMFLVYGVLRCITFGITLFSITTDLLAEKAVFWSMAIWGLLFPIANFMMVTAGYEEYSAILLLFAIIVPLGSALIGSRFCNKQVAKA